MLKQFKQFAPRGCVLDVALGLIPEGASGRIASSFGSTFYRPSSGRAAEIFPDLFIPFPLAGIQNLGAAGAAGAPALNHGAFAGTVDLRMVSIGGVLIDAVGRRMAAPAPTPRPHAGPRWCGHSSIPFPAVCRRHCTPHWNLSGRGE